MKSTGYYVVRAGRRLWADTLTEIRKIARQVADETGKPVTVHGASKPKAKPGAARRAAAARTMRRNPDPGSLVDVLFQMERGRQARREFVAATKGKRIAKSMRRRGGSPAEAGAKKTAKFAVDAKSRKERFTIFRASRSAAESLARQFEAAGYTTVVREV